MVTVDVITVVVGVVGVVLQRCVTSGEHVLFAPAEKQNTAPYLCRRHSPLYPRLQDSRHRSTVDVGCVLVKEVDVLLAEEVTEVVDGVDTPVVVPVVVSRKRETKFVAVTKSPPPFGSAGAI